MDEFGYLYLIQSPDQYSKASYCHSEYLKISNRLPEKDGYLHKKINITDLSIQNVKQIAKGRKNVFPEKVVEKNEETPGKTGLRCSRIALLVFILRMALISTFIVLLSIYIVKMEMLQKEFSYAKSSFEKQFGCSVHLALQGNHLENFPAFNSTFQVVKGWSYYAQNTHINLDCIKPDEVYSKFKVLENGAYFFYCQLSFYADEEMLKTNYKNHLFMGQKVFSNDHLLLDQSSLVNVPQLEVGQPMPNCGGFRGSLHVSTLSGIIVLEAGEELSIQALPVLWLCRRRNASFFGMYKIGD